MNPILARVREVLRETGKTQRALAEDGVAPQQVLSRWMTVDSAEPSASSLATLCEKLGVNGDWVLRGVGDKYSPSVGADALIKRGMQLGLQWAEEAMRTLRAADPDGAGLPPALAALATSAARDSGGELAAHGEKVLAERADDLQTDAGKPAGKASRRSRGGGGA